MHCYVRISVAHTATVSVNAKNKTKSAPEKKKKVCGRNYINMAGTDKRSLALQRHGPSAAAWAIGGSGQIQTHVRTHTHADDFTIERYLVIRRIYYTFHGGQLAMCLRH